mmetsp:Transcript_88788/g.230415  ORF Transcript_88788/g.230415 Transcript_88788/m.230415 type:complete len:269 (-) Transcript_88788:451-1257(-)
MVVVIPGLPVDSCTHDARRVRQGPDRLGLLVQRIFLLLCHTRRGGGAALRRHLRSNSPRARVPGFLDNSDYLGRHLLCDHPSLLCKGQADFQHLRFLHGCRAAPEDRHSGHQDGGRDARLMDLALAHHIGWFYRDNAPHGLDGEPGSLHGSRARLVRQRLCQGRTLHPVHVGHYYREVRLDVVLVEPRGRAASVLLPVRLPLHEHLVWFGPPPLCANSRLLRRACCFIDLGLLGVGPGELSQVLLQDGAARGGLEAQLVPDVPACGKP